MPKRKHAPDLTFQKHIADYLIREHEYGVFEQADITDTEHCIAEDYSWTFQRSIKAYNEYGFCNKGEVDDRETA